MTAVKPEPMRVGAMGVGVDCRGLAHGLALAGRGYRVFPAQLTEDGQKPPQHGVMWRRDATADPARIREWAARWPDTLWGINCGDSGIVAVDLDPGSDPDQHGIETSGVNAYPTRRGQHVLYREPRGRVVGCPTAATHGMPHVDVKGTGGYVVAWGLPCPVNELPELPAALTDRVTRGATDIAKGDARQVPPALFAPTDKHNHEFTYEEAVHYLRPYMNALREAEDGTINTTLNSAAFEIGRFIPCGLFTRESAILYLKNALSHTVYDGRKWSADTTIASGLDAKTRDWVAVQWTEPRINGTAGAIGPVRRKLTVRRGSAGQVRRTRYVWEGRYPVGVLSLLAGREGTGKSTVAYDRAAMLTRGVLPGEHERDPRSVIVCAGEDSWEHTILPRLIAADADLDRILHVVAETEIGDMEISLPGDIAEVTEIVHDENVGMILLDPLMSMLDGKMNSDKYQEVYAALRPVMGMAELTGVAVVGITHFNKTAGTDPLSRVMASRAFSAAPRSILMTHLDESEGEDDENDFSGPGDSRPVERFILGHEKHNLGPKARTLAYHIETIEVGWDDGPIVSSRVVWDGESDNTVSRAMEGMANRKTAPTVNACAGWLIAFLSKCGGSAEVPTIKAECEKAKMSWRSTRDASSRPQFVRVPPAPGRPARWGLVGVDLDGDTE